MRSLSQLRGKLKLTQHQMAEFLGVNRVVVEEVEKGIRSLPDYAFQKFNMLAIAMHTTSVAGKTAQPDTDTTSKTNSSSFEKYRRRSRKCLHVATTLKMKLEKMESDYAKTLAWVETIHLLKQQSHNEWQSLWFSIQLGKAERKLFKYGLDEQLKLKIRIELLEAEAEVLGRLVNG